MQFFRTDIHLPVDQYRFNLSVDIPRTPTPFEWVAARIVNDFRGLDEYSSATIADVFRTAFGGQGAEQFVTRAIDELFSSTVNVLETDNHDVEYASLPIRDIRLTEEGERLMKTGKLASKSKECQRKAVYDPITRELLPNDFEAGELPEGAVTLATETEVGANPPIEAVRAREEATLKNGSRVGRVESQSAPRRLWRRQFVSFGLENENLRLLRDERTISQGTADYLESLPPERVRELFFAREFSPLFTTPDEVVPMSGKKVARVHAPAELARLSPSVVSVAFKGKGEAVPAFTGKTLEVVAGDGLRLEEDPQTGVLRLVAPAADFPVPVGASCDQTTMYIPLRTRLFYSGMPMELPVVCETAVDGDERTRLDKYLRDQIAALPAADRERVEALLGEEPENELVWTERSSKEYPHRKHGKHQKHGKKRNNRR